MADHGRIKLDASIHAEYTSHISAWKAVVDFAGEYNLNMQIHLSETELEHQNCIAKHGKTPAELFYECGALDIRATLAHCVWVSDEDIDLLVEKDATAAHNPVSNLKLASGIARVTEMQKRGLNVSLGTDGVSSNNSLDMFEEVKMCSLLQKSITRDASALPAPEALKIATVNGAFAQGRENETGRLAVDFDADIIMLDLSVPNLNPCHQEIDTIVYSASGKDVIMTMVMGKILYENGIYYTLDLEKIYYELENQVLPLLR